MPIRQKNNKRVWPQHFYLRQNLSTIAPWLLGAFLIIFFFTTRLFNLTALPIFVDEGLHISRAQRMLESGDFIHGTAAGKFLHIWWLTSVINLIASPLLIARILSIIAGLASGIATFYLAYFLWSQRNLGWLTAFIYIALPLPLMNDRMALADSLITALTTLTLIFSLKHIHQPARLTGYALGVCLGLTYLTKINGLIYIVIPIFSHILLRQNWRHTTKILIRPYLMAFLIALPTVTEFLNQFLSVAVRGLPDPTQPRIPTFHWWLYGLGETWLDLTTYVTLPILLLATIRLLYDIKIGDQRSALFAILLLLTPTVYTLLGKDVWYSRYLLPMVPIFVTLAARTLADLAHMFSETTRLKQEKLWLIILYFLTLLPSFIFNYHLITKPDQAPFTPVDRWQYVVGWPAGYGLPETVNWLQQEVTQKKSLTIITTQYSSPAQEGIRLYLGNQQNIHFISTDLRNEADERLASLIQNQDMPTLLLLNEPADQDIEPLSSLCPTVLAVFPKPENQSRLVIKECMPSQ